MSKREFFKAYKNDIDAVYISWADRPAKNNREREDVILNDEGMYRLARKKGVRV
jgi:hypothetical protein